MEASLIDLILYIASLFLTHIAKHFGQNIFQRIVAHGTSLLTGRLHGLVAVVTDIEGGTIEMAAVLCGITIILYA